MRVGIANVLKDEGFIEDYNVEAAKPASVLHVHLRYGVDGEKVIRSIIRVSKPGRRAYASLKELARPARPRHQCSLDAQGRDFRPQGP